MSRAKRLLLALGAGLLCCVPAIGITVLELDATIRGMQAATGPQVLDDWVLFSHQQQSPVRYVGARFAHQGFGELHLYQRNEAGVFVLLLAVPAEIRQLEYRIVVDGQWSTDPENARTRVDDLGLDFSVLELPATPRDLPLGISTGPGGIVFRFRSAPSQMVSVNGDFSGWNPFIFPMAEVSPGMYQTTVRLPLGGYGYTFVVNGRRVIDPANPVTNVAGDGRMVSWLGLSG